MALTLNHFSIRTLDMESTRRFYVDILGLTVGPRPPFPFPGMWLYRGDQADAGNAVVHVIGMDANDPVGLKNYLGERDVSTLSGSGAVDHIAFFADGLAQMLSHLKAHGVAARERTVPAIGLHQLFLDDPNGIVVELNYPTAEKEALDAAR
ncbi:MAG: VOC family protein [Burkholderiales bacterium]|nr:VOC family protein [Burkholderiales bacterium]